MNQRLGKLANYAIHVLTAQLLNGHGQAWPRQGHRLPMAWPCHGQVELEAGQVGLGAVRRLGKDSNCLGVAIVQQWFD